MMKSIMVIGAVVLLSAPVAMAKERSFGACAADVKAKCAEVKPGGAASKNALKHTPQNFPSRARKGLRGSPRSAKPARLTSRKIALARNEVAS